MSTTVVDSFHGIDLCNGSIVDIENKNTLDWTEFRRL